MPLTPKEQEVAELLLKHAVNDLQDEARAGEFSYTHCIDSYKSLMEGARNRTDMVMAEWAVDQQKRNLELQAQGLAASLQHGKPKGPVSYGG